MRYGRVTRNVLIDFLRRLDAAFARPGRVYLVGETTQVFENWRRWAGQIEFTADVASEHRAAFSRVVQELVQELGIAAFDESPGDVIPLPDGYETRARRAGSGARSTNAAVEGSGFLKHLSLYHFDPYSVAFRFIARGDEPDYHLVLMFLEHGWVTVEEMDERLAALLPRFTTETIAQDPAEFRRKYKGMLQMWRALKPRTTHRSTTV